MSSNPCTCVSAPAMQVASPCLPSSPWSSDALRLGTSLGFLTACQPPRACSPSRMQCTRWCRYIPVSCAASVSPGVQNRTVRPRGMTGPDQGCFSCEALDICFWMLGRNCPLGDVSRLTGARTSVHATSSITVTPFPPTLEAPLWSPPHPPLPSPCSRARSPPGRSLSPR